MQGDVVAHTDYIYEVYCTLLMSGGRATCNTRIALASSLEMAEALIRTDIDNRFGLETVHSYNVTRMPVDLRVCDREAIEEYRYDDHGILLGRRVCTDPNGKFMGRDPEACRLRVGDMCEAIVNGELILGIVESLPPSPETARRILAANGGTWGLDSSDDCYGLLLKTPDRKFTHMPVDTLNVFTPRCKPQSTIVRSFTMALADFRTAPVRLAIRAVSAKEKLQSVLDELEIEGAITTPVFPQECLALDLPAESLPNLDSGEITIVIPLRKVEKHLDMVRVGLARLAGKEVSGRGYHLKDCPPEEYWYGLSDNPIHSF